MIMAPPLKGARQDRQDAEPSPVLLFEQNPKKLLMELKMHSKSVAISLPVNKTSCPVRNGKTGKDAEPSPHLSSFFSYFFEKIACLILLSARIG